MADDPRYGPSTPVNRGFGWKGGGSVWNQRVEGSAATRRRGARPRAPVPPAPPLGRYKRQGGARGSGGGEVRAASASRGGDGGRVEGWAQSAPPPPTAWRGAGPPTLPLSWRYTRQVGGGSGEPTRRGRRVGTPVGTPVGEG